MKALKKSIYAQYAVSSAFNQIILSSIDSYDGGKKEQLKSQLADHFQSNLFLQCRTMGEVVKQTLRYSLKPHLSRMQRNLGKIVD